jgi:amino acid adenylation domain-containing protein
MIDLGDHALHARFLRGLAISPRATAFRVGAESLSYEAMHELALQWAGRLLDSTSERPTAVGVLSNKGTEAYVGILAALYAGLTAVPLHPDFPAARTKHMVEAAGVSVVLADEAGLATLTRTGLQLPTFVPSREAADAALRRGMLSQPNEVQPSDVAYMLFTSGSTGRPKGVPLTHANTRHYFGLTDQRYDFTADDVFSQTTEVNFDCAMFEMFSAWGAGASVHAVPAQAYLDLPAFVAERGMSVWFSTPSAIAFVRKLGGLRPDSMPSLRWSFFAGEALLCSDVSDWTVAASNSTVENLYGPTELTVTITGHRWQGEASIASAVNGIVPIGGLHAGHDSLLLTSDETSSETEGELCITGPQMTAGYLDPADNAGRFLQRDGRSWYRTGDWVRRLPDGELVYLGRMDAQVQIQGWRVELAEVDNAIRGCDGVIDAATVTRPYQSGLELVVFYTGEQVSPAVLSRQLREVLPSGLLPRHYQRLAEFPLNSNRKIDRKQLAADALAMLDPAAATAQA